MNKTFSVWIDGGEVNAYLLTRDQAESLASEWKERGYDPIITDNGKRYICELCGFKCDPSGAPCNLCNDTLCGACCGGDN